MRRTALIPLLAMALALFAAPAFAGPGFDVGARAYYWFPELTGNVQTTLGGITDNTTFDVKDDLGVEDENFAAGEAFLRVGRFHFRLGYTPLDFSGDKVLTRTIRFEGVDYSAGQRVQSQLDLKTYDGEIQVDLFRPSIPAVANLYVGVMAKVKYVDGNVELRNVTTPTVKEKDFNAPIPMVGLAAGAGVLGDIVRVDARAAGIAYSGNHLYEGDIYASVAPFPFLKLQGGYRLIDLKVDDDDFKGEIKLKGPYVGLQAAF